MLSSMGEFLIPPRFEDAEQFLEGLAAVAQVCDNDQCGYIDRAGQSIWPSRIHEKDEA
jgi:hypothetical protein